MTDLTSLTQLLKNKEAPDVTPPFSLANLGSLIFLNSDATADIVLPIIVVTSVSTVVLCWNITTYLLLGEWITRLADEGVSWMTSYWVIVIWIEEIGLHRMTRCTCKMDMLARWYWWSVFVFTPQDCFLVKIYGTTSFSVNCARVRSRRLLFLIPGFYLRPRRLLSVECVNVLKAHQFLLRPLKFERYVVRWSLDAPDSTPPLAF